MLKKSSLLLLICLLLTAGHTTSQIFELLPNSHQQNFNNFKQGKTRLQIGSVNKSLNQNNEILKTPQQLEDIWSKIHNDATILAKFYPNLKKYPAALISEKSKETNASFQWIRLQIELSCKEEAQKIKSELLAVAQQQIDLLENDVEPKSKALVFSCRKFIKNPPEVITLENKDSVYQASGVVERFEYHNWN